MYTISRFDAAGRLEFATYFGTGWTLERWSALEFKSAKAATEFQATLAGETICEKD